MQHLIMTDAWFVSESFAILAKNDICHSLHEALNKIKLSFDTFVQGRSGWTVHKFMKAMLVVDRCKRFKARCTGRKSLPQSVRAKRALLCIQNIPTDQCFLYVVAVGLAKVSHNPQNSSLYKHIVRDLEEETGISGRVGEKEINYFEKNCNVSVNVYTYEGVLHNHFT